MSKEELDLVDSIDTLDDLKLYEEILELRVKAQSKLFMESTSSWMKNSSGIVLGGLGGWLVSQLFKDEKGSQDHKEENQNLKVSSSSALEQMDHYIGLFQKWSPILRAIIADSDSEKRKRTAEEAETI